MTNNIKHPRKCQCASCVELVKPMTIWKFPVPIQGPEPFAIHMPLNSTILSVQMQQNAAQMWCCVNPDTSICRRFFKWFPTGAKPDLEIQPSNYVATIQDCDGFFIWHLFEVFE